MLRNGQSIEDISRGMKGEVDTLIKVPNVPGKTWLISLQNDRGFSGCTQAKVDDLKTKLSMLYCSDYMMG